MFKVNYIQNNLGMKKFDASQHIKEELLDFLLEIILSERQLDKIK